MTSVEISTFSQPNIRTIARSDVLKMIDPRISLEERTSLYEQQQKRLKLETMQQVANMLIYEHDVPEYLVNMQLSKEWTFNKPAPAVHMPQAISDDMRKLPYVDPKFLQSLMFSSIDEDVDDTEELREDLHNIIETCQDKDVTVGDFMKHGPMNNDYLDHDLRTKQWCSDAQDGTLHGMYTCTCMLSDLQPELEMKCGGCGTEISDIKDCVRLPYGDISGWNTTLYCNPDCVIIDPPFEITSSVQLKFLVGLELMSMIERKDYGEKDVDDNCDDQSSDEEPIEDCDVVEDIDPEPTD